MKTIALSALLAFVGIGSAAAQADLRGNAFGRTTLVGRSGPDVFPTMVGTIQQTINDFRSESRGEVRSSLMVASNDGGAMSARDVFSVRGGRLTMRTTFLSVCGCEGPGEVTLRGRARVRPRAIIYRANSGDGQYSLRGTIRVKRNRIARTETRTIYDPDFDETDVFRFSSSLFLQGRSGR